MGPQMTLEDIGQDLHVWVTDREFVFDSHFGHPKALADFEGCSDVLGEYVLAVGHEGGISMIQGCAGPLDVRNVHARDCR